MTDQKPSDALTKRPNRLRAGLIAAGVVVALSGVGGAAFALNQPQPAPVEPTQTAQPATEPTEEPNIAPVAVMSHTTSGLTVNLDGTASTDADGEIVSYWWDFGDGPTGTGATLSHTYANAGTYDLTLIVTDDDGAEHVVFGSVTVTAPAPPAPPSAPSCPSGAFPNEVSNGVIISCIYGPDYCSEHSPDHPDWHCRGPFNV